MSQPQPLPPPPSSGGRAAAQPTQPSTESSDWDWTAPEPKPSPTEPSPIEAVLLEVDFGPNPELAQVARTQNAVRNLVLAWVDYELEQQTSSEEPAEREQVRLVVCSSVTVNPWREILTALAGSSVTLGVAITSAVFAALLKIPSLLDAFIEVSLVGAKREARLEELKAKTATSRAEAISATQGPILTVLKAVSEHAPHSDAANTLLEALMACTEDPDLLPSARVIDSRTANLQRARLTEAAALQAPPAGPPDQDWSELDW